MIETQLSTAVRWRGRVYGPGPASLPSDLAIALGISPAVAPAPEPPEAPALTLINSATTQRAIAAIPTVGPKAAGIILAQRPEGGYGSLDDLPAEIFDAPINADLTEITDWEG